MRCNRPRSKAGFTLIEVLIALVVVAVGLTAVLQAGGRAVADTTELREKTFAGWIGSNVVTEYQLAGAWETGDERVERDFAGRTWPVRVTVRPDADAMLRDRVRVIEVTVFEPGRPESNLRVVHGFLVNPELAR